MNTAFVHIWGELVGAVAWNETRGIATFEYDPKFMKRDWDLAPIQMPVSRDKRVFEFPALRKKPGNTSDTFKGLPGLLADSLPDRYGNELINLWLASQGRPMDSMNPVEMLCFIGKRGIGALEYEPATLKENKRASAIEIQSIVNIARRILSRKESFSTILEKDDEKAVVDILRIGTSAGGARPKALIAFNENTKEVRSGQVNAPNGFGHWLIKFDGVSDIQLGKSHGYGRVEMAYYNMAIDCGIKMMPSRLLEENGRAHFMTKRFDREGESIKHHIQTLCAMMHFDFNLINSYSYEQIFQTLRVLRIPYPDVEQLYRRMIFNVLARNCDDHTKNFSFLLRKDGVWELAPAYDICHAYHPGNQWVSHHALSINGKRDNFTRNDLLSAKQSVKNKKAVEIIDEIKETVGKWRMYANEVGVSSKLRDEIGKTLVSIT